MTQLPSVADLGEDTTVIQIPLPIPAPPWTNCYLIRTADQVTLIDCGADSQEAWDALEAGLSLIGLDPGDIDLLIGTHLHFDHVGMAKRLVDETGCSFLMHEGMKKSIDAYNDWTIFREMVSDLAVENGVPEEIKRAMGEIGKRPAWAGVAFEPDRLISDLAEIPLGSGRTLTALHTPGHEEAHICMLDSESGALYSGDHILSRITPVVLYQPGEDRLGTYLDSLARIENMDLGTTFPAHADVLERGSLRARQIALHHERRLGAMVQELRHEPKTAWQIVTKVFRPHLTVIEQRFALLETLAHLEYLVIRHEIEHERIDGTWYYRPHSRYRIASSR